MSIHTPADLPQVELRPITLTWVLKQSAIGIGILTIVIGCMAWLTYASIDPRLDAQVGEPTAPAATLTKVELSR
jgi:hypothetical protein